MCSRITEIISDAIPSKIITKKTGDKVRFNDKCKGFKKETQDLSPAKEEEQQCKQGKIQESKTDLQQGRERSKKRKYNTKLNEDLNYEQQSQQQEVVASY